MAVRENDVLSRYLQSLYGIEPLSVEEEHELAKRIAKGDEKAVEKLVTHNLRFVVRVVREMSAWHHGNVMVEDIIGMGNEALFMAARQWTTPMNGARFVTFAKPFIELGVRREINNTSNIIRLPVNIMEQIKLLNYNTNMLSMVLNREPTDREIAISMGINKKQLQNLRVMIEREPISINNLKQEKRMEENADD